MKFSAYLTLATAALLLAACGSGDSGDGDGYSADEGGDATYSGSLGDDENNVDIRAGGDIEVDLPSGYSVYPGAKVVTSMATNTVAGKGKTLIMESDDAASKVVTFYRGQAESAGVEISTEIASSDTNMISGKTPDNQVFNLVVNDSDGTSTIQLSIMQAVEE